MKLYWSTRSPFARKVAIAVEELGADDLVAFVPTVVRDRPQELLAINPLCQLPTLDLGGGRGLYDSAVICEYLDLRFSPGRLFPQELDARMAAARWQALGDGMMDAALLRQREIARADTEAERDLLRAAFPPKVQAGLDRLEEEAALLTASEFGIGHITVGCAASYLDFRSHHLDWRADRPELARWAENFEARASAVATRLHD